MKLFGHEWTFKKNSNTKNFLEMVVDEQEELNLYLYAYALHVVIDLIASVMSNIEFKTYGDNDKEKKSTNWVKFNVHPNRNQTSTEFIKELVKKLLLGDVLVVIVDEQYIIADDFTLTEKAIVDNVFTNVRKGDYTFRDKKFKGYDVIYLHYGNDAINHIIQGITEMYEKLIGTASDKYARSGEEKGVLSIDQAERGRKDFAEIYEDLINNRFKTFFSRGNHVLPLFNGYTYTSSTAEATKKYSNEITDVKTLFEDAISRVAQAYKVPVGLIRGDVAGIQDAYTMFLTNCIDPLAHMISEELTYKLYSEDQIINGYAIEADTTNVKHIDIFDLATAIDKLIASGFLSIDEVREKVGLRGFNEEWSTLHWMTLNYTTAEAAVAAGKETSRQAAENADNADKTDNDEGSEDEE
jgi:HK97 family phage portal protein